MSRCSASTPSPGRLLGSRHSHPHRGKHEAPVSPWCSHVSHRAAGRRKTRPPGRGSSLRLPSFVSAFISAVCDRMEACALPPLHNPLCMIPTVKTNCRPGADGFILYSNSSEVLWGDSQVRRFQKVWGHYEPASCALRAYLWLL